MQSFIAITPTHTHTHTANVPTQKMYGIESHTANIGLCRAQRTKEKKQHTFDKILPSIAHSNTIHIYIQRNYDILSSGCRMISPIRFCCSLTSQPHRHCRMVNVARIDHAMDGISMVNRLFVSARNRVQCNQDELARMSLCDSDKILVSFCPVSLE